MKIKKLTSIALSAMMAAAVVPFNEATVPYNSISSYAAGAEASKSVAEGTLGENIAWTLYDSGQLSISGSGAIMGSDGANPWGEYTDDITSVVLEHGITEIGDYAFYGCENLIFVSLEYKGGLDRIGLNAFDGCSKLMDMEIGGHIGKIGDFAFNGCEMLDKITITNSDCVIADSQFVFHENTVIEGFAGSTAEIYSNNYNREFASLGVITPDSGEQEVAASGTCGATLTWSIYDDKRLVINGNGVMDSYEGYSNWEEYTELFDTVEYSGELGNYGEYAFYNCKNLKEFEIAPVIGAHAFEGCSNISGVKVPKGFVLNEIGDYAFYGCDNLGMLIIGNPECVIADSPYVFPENMVIYGVAGSTAQAYAEKYNREFIDISEPGFGEQEVVAEGTCGENLTWKIYEDEKCLIVSGYGAMDSYENPGEAPWADYYNYIEAVRLESGVENIGENTFASLNSKRLDIIIIENPDCIIPDSETIIPARMTIGGAAGSTAQAYAEKYNREFIDIIEPDSGEQEVIEQGTLFEKFQYKLTSMGEFIVEGEGKLEDLTRWSIAFENSEKVTSLTLSENITAIGAYNFFNCNNLGSMYIGKNVESIGDYAFYGCYNADFIGIENPQCVIADSPYVFPKDMVIGGYAGSTAEAYAKKYNREFYAFPEEVANGKLSESVTWRLNSDGSLYVEGEGDIPDCDSVNIWGEYADSITNVQFAGNFRKIGDYAFSNCKNLQEIYGATGVIGEHAFEGCKKLENVNIYNVEIGDFAFSGCDNLNYIYIDEESVIADSPNVFPENVTIAGESDNVKAYAEKYNLNYEDCTLAAEGKLDENYMWYLSNNGVLNLSGEGNMINGKKANLWGEYSDKIEFAFFDIRSGSIGEYAFYNCKNLEEVGYGYSVYDSLKIGSHAFEGCEKLTSFSAFENVIKIDNYAFNGCDSLEYVSIFNPECAIADSEFVFPENTVIYGYTGSTAEAYAKKYNRTFESWGEIEDKFIGEGKLSETIEYTLTGDGVLTISGEGMLSNTINDNMCGFWGSLADKINTIELSDDITEIGDNMFAGCENLVHIFTNANVIGEHAFEGCTSLLPVTLKEADKIGDYAFYNTDVSRVEIFNPECEIADSPYVFPEDMVIYGVAGSTAEAYAEKYNREFKKISAPDLGWQAVVAKGTCGENLTWKIYEDERCLIVSGYGAMDSYENPDETPWADYYNYIGTVRFESGVENIGENTLASLNSGYLNIIIIENPVCFIPDSETTIPARIAIGGAAGSTAEAYAEKYNREFLAIVENDEGLPIAEGMCGESAKWALYDGGFLEIYGEGKMVNYDDFSNTPWAEYADSIKELSIGENIASISENAFAGCLNIRYTSIYNSKCKIPDSVYALPTTSIIGYCGSTAEAYAKKYHMGFKAIPTVIASGQCGENIDWAVYDVGILSIDGKGAMVDFDDFSSTPWFEYADLITQVNVGDIDSVGENAFSGLTKLQDISFNNLKCVIPDSEDAIPDRATINGNLGSLAIEYAKKYDKDYYIYTYEIARGELVNGQNWTFDSDGYLMIDGSGNMPNYEGDNPWSEFDDSIIAVYLNSDITSIGDYAFYNCTNLKNIFTNATVIGEHAFEGCTSLLPVTLKEADKIGDYAFYNTDVSRVEIFNPECEIADSPYVFPEDTIIYGYKNSTAEEYARKYERMFLAFQTFLLGDVNKDGKIDSTDASAVLAEYAASQTGGELTLSKDAADVNDDGLVNSSDASAILEYYAKASIGEEPSWNLTDVTK